MRRWIAAALAAAALSGCELEPPSVGGEDGRRQGARVVRAVDGDTIDVKIGSREETVRLIGIDTPETVRPGVSVECGGPEASEAMRQMARAGDRLRLISDPTQEDEDRYGRLLRYVEEDGEDLGEAQVRAGHAEVYVYGAKPFERLGRYRKAARSAESGGAGVWGACGGDFHGGS
jgi:micrococcal nuclease